MTLILPENQSEEKKKGWYNPFEEFFLWYSYLHDTFGGKVLWALTLCHAAHVGIQLGIQSIFTLPYYREIGVSGQDYQIYMHIGEKLPAAFKPIYGFMSDLYPLGGYKNRNYMLLYSIIFGFTSWILIGKKNNKKTTHSVWGRGEEAKVRVMVYQSGYIFKNAFSTGQLM
jgi:nitrate/nitrite transporter NarK